MRTSTRLTAAPRRPAGPPRVSAAQQHRGPLELLERQPEAHLLAQPAQERGRGVEAHEGQLGPGPDDHLGAVAEADLGDAVGGDVDPAALDGDAQGDHLGEHDGARDDRVGRQRHHHDGAHPRVDRRPAGAQRVGGRAGGGGHHHTVGVEVAEQLAVLLHPDAGHGHAARLHRHLVERQRLPRRAVPLAGHRGLEHGAALGVAAPRGERLERGGQVGHLDVGEEPEPAPVDPHHRDARAGRRDGRRTGRCRRRRW